VIQTLKRIALLLAFGAALLGVARDAHADEKTRGAELKRRGDEAMDALSYGAALEHYSAAYDATKDPALLYNMGRVHEALSQYPDALDKLTAFQQQASPELRARVPGLAERIADVRTHVAVLVLKASVSGARVLVRKKELGVTPLAGPIKTNAGPATIEVIADGYRPFRTEVVLPGGRELTVEATLLSKSTSGVLVVDSPVVGALVQLDGKDAGTVPVEIVARIGAHPLVLQKDGYETSTTSVVLAADERKTVMIPLEKKAPITSKWWFWTGIGVVVVGGAVTTYALLTERKADTGTYPPGQVSGPLRF
jgi:hypothetical protein